MPWADEAAVLELTGAVVDSAQLAQAQGIIDLFAGVVPDSAGAAGLGARDTRLLRQAVAYQAAFMAAQVDVTGRMETTQQGQDGATLTVADTDAHVLAPLARRALMGVSWRRRSGTIHVGRAGRRRYPTFDAAAAAWLRDESPACDEEWRPL